MPKLTTNKFKLHNAAQFKEQFDEAAKTNIYFFIGKNLPWVNDNSPPSPIDNTDLNLEIWKNMLSLKKINAADVSYGAVRNDWTTGTVYTKYTSNTKKLLS